MRMLEMIGVGIGTVVGLIVLVVLIAFLAELVKAFWFEKNKKDKKS